MTKSNRGDARVLDARLLRAVTGGESAYNKKETLASSIQKKRDDVDSAVIDKI